MKDPVCALDLNAETAIGADGAGVVGGGQGLGVERGDGGVGFYFSWVVDGLDVISDVDLDGVDREGFVMIWCCGGRVCSGLDRRFRAEA